MLLELIYVVHFDLLTVGCNVGVGKVQMVVCKLGYTATARSTL